jgi:hypothetical protein
MYVLWRWLVNDALCEGFGGQPSGAFDDMAGELWLGHVIYNEQCGPSVVLTLYSLVFSLNVREYKKSSVKSCSILVYKLWQGQLFSLNVAISLVWQPANPTHYPKL